MIPRLHYGIFKIGKRRFIEKGQNARALYALIKAGKRGITSLEMSSWALRLGQYIFTLRGRGLDIITEREPHDTGYHARYFLKTPVEIVKVQKYVRG